MTSSTSLEPRPLGRPGADVSVVGLGTWQLGGDWGNVTEDDAAAVLDAALDAGVRQAGISADTVYGDRGLKGAMKAADRSGASHAVVVGDRDLAEGVAQLRDLRSHEQVAVPLDELFDLVRATVGR